MALRFLRPNTQIDFIGIRRIAYVISFGLIVLSVIFMLTKGVRYGIDFDGGVIVQVKFDRPVEDETLKQSLSSAQELAGLSIQRFGSDDTEYLLRLSVPEASGDEIRHAVSTALDQHLSGVTYKIQRLEQVGPKVGGDLKNKALEAIFFSILLIAIYISGRFEQRWVAAGIMAAALGGGMYALSLLGLGMFYLVPAAMIVVLAVCWLMRLNFAMGAIVSIIHDVIITMGVLVALGKEFDLNILAALLTIVGYSLNDTIIVFDRIREVMHARKDAPFGEIINQSINQTLSRTILTGLTTLMVLVVLFFLGGGVIHDFALTMFLGVLVGMLSSIFVASPILLALGKPQIDDPAPRVGMEGAV